MHDQASNERKARKVEVPGGSWVFDAELAWHRLHRQPLKAIAGSWAVAAAVLAVLFVLALGDGLHRYLSERLQLVTPAIWVEWSQPGGLEPEGFAPGGPAEGESALGRSPGASRADALTVLRAIPGVREVSPQLQGAVLAEGGRNVLPARLEGYDPTLLPEVIPLSSRQLTGRLPRTKGEAAVGVQLARSLGAGVGDPLRLVGPASQSTTVTIVGLLEAGFSSVDAELIWTDDATAGALLGEHARRGFAVGVRPGEDLEALRIEIQSRLGAWSVPWYEANHGLFEALAVERQVMFWISLSALVTAAFAGGSVALLRVFERRYELGVLQAMGATPGSLLRTVLFETAGGAAVGAALGLVLGRAAFAALARYPIDLPPRFGVRTLPVEPAWWHAALALALAIASTCLAAVIPAVRASRTDPVHALRGR